MMSKRLLKFAIISPIFGYLLGQLLILYYMPMFRRLFGDSIKKLSTLIEFQQKSFLVTLLIALIFFNTVCSIIFLIGKYKEIKQVGVGNQKE